MDTRNRRNDDQAPPQTERKHPDEWAGDLEPDHMAGQNVGAWPGERETELPSAYDVKEAHRSLREEFADDELRQIPILREGERLQQGATYVDLHGDRREFTATGAMSASGEHWFVPKDRVPYPLWNRLLGVENPARLDRPTSESPDR